MRGVMVALLVVLSASLLAATPGGPSAGIGDGPDVLDVEGSAPGGAAPGGSGTSGGGGGAGQTGGDGSGSGGGSGSSSGGAGGGGASGSGSSGGAGPGTGSGASGGSDPAAPSGGIDAFEPSWSVQPTSGEPCILLSRRPGVAPDSELGLQWDRRTLRMMVDPRVFGRSDRFCAVEGGEAVAGGAVTASPQAAATAFVRSIALPRPQPSIPPGIALTGLPSYLVIAGQESFGVTDELPGWGPLTVRFTNVATVVDWGDGTRVVIEDGRRGAPYGGDPHAQITHIYDHHDPDTEVVVTTLWRASWSVGGYAGTVHGLMTRATLTLPVRSFEAIRVAPDA